MGRHQLLHEHACGVELDTAAPCLELDCNTVFNRRLLSDCCPRWRRFRIVPPGGVARSWRRRLSTLSGTSLALPEAIHGRVKTSVGCGYRPPAGGLPRRPDDSCVPIWQKSNRRKFCTKFPRLGETNELQADRRIA